MENTKKQYVLVADSGGTNIRFRLLDPKTGKYVQNTDGNDFEFCAQHKESGSFVKECKDLKAELDKQGLNNWNITHVCMDVAGPLDTKTGTFTTTNTLTPEGEPWTWNVKTIKAALTEADIFQKDENNKTQDTGFNLISGGVASKDGKIVCVNDLAAHTAGLNLDKVKVIPLGSGDITNENDIVYIVPGTGLGVGIRKGGISDTTEGGSFGLPSKSYVQDLFENVQRRDKEGDRFYPSSGLAKQFAERFDNIIGQCKTSQGKPLLFAEDVISGRALWTMYNSALDLNQQNATKITAEQGSIEFMNRLKNNDPVAVEVMDACVLPVLVSVIHNMQCANPQMRNPVICLGGFFAAPVYQKYFTERQDWLNEAMKHHDMQGEALKNFKIAIVVPPKGTNLALDGLSAMALTHIKAQENSQKKFPPQPVFSLPQKGKKIKPKDRKRTYRAYCERLKKQKGR